MPNPINDNQVYDVPVSALVGFPGNARQGALVPLMESLRVNGQFRPIVVRRETREILAGNHTWKAAKQLNWKTVKVTYVENISDDDAKRIVLADNRLNDLATYNVPDLTALLDSLPTLEGTGFDNYEMVNLEAAFSEPAPNVSETLGNGETKVPRTITCPNCSHAWEA